MRLRPAEGSSPTRYPPCAEPEARDHEQDRSSVEQAEARALGAAGRTPRDRAGAVRLHRGHPLARVDQPAHWLRVTRDGESPVEQCAALLPQLQRAVLAAEQGDDEAAAVALRRADVGVPGGVGEAGLT